MCWRSYVQTTYQDLLEWLLHLLCVLLETVTSWLCPAWGSVVMAPFLLVPCNGHLGLMPLNSVLCNAVVFLADILGLLCGGIVSMNNQRHGERYVQKEILGRQTRTSSSPS